MLLHPAQREILSRFLHLLVPFPFFSCAFLPLPFLLPRSLSQGQFCAWGAAQPPCGEWEGTPVPKYLPASCWMLLWRGLFALGGWQVYGCSARLGRRTRGWPSRHRASCFCTLPQWPELEELDPCCSSRGCSVFTQPSAASEDTLP